MVFQDANGNMFSLSECNISVTIQNILNESSKALKTLNQLKKLKKTVIIIGEATNIIKSIQSIVIGEDIFDTIHDIIGIAYSLTTIFTTLMDVKIPNWLSNLMTIDGIATDSKDVIDGVKNNDKSKILKGVTSVILDFAFLGAEKYVDNNIKTSNVNYETIQKEGRNQLYEITMESILNGGISDKDKGTLMGWAYDFEYVGEIYYLFNR